MRDQGAELCPAGLNLSPAYPGGDPSTPTPTLWELRRVSPLSEWQLLRKEEALSADGLSVGFPVAQRRRFPGTTATPGIPSPGCRVHESESGINRPL